MVILFEFWFVVARETEPGENEETPFVQVWGPFDLENDARCFAIEVWHDNGWGNVEAEYLTFAEAADRSTDRAFHWPYKKEEQGVV